MFDNVIAFGMGLAAGSGWVLFTLTLATVRRIRKTLDLATRANHDLYTQLMHERAAFVQGLAEAANADGSLGQCAVGCADAVLKQAKSWKPNSEAN